MKNHIQRPQGPDLAQLDNKEDKDHLEFTDDARPLEELAVSANFGKKVQKSAMLKVRGATISKSESCDTDPSP